MLACPPHRGETSTTIWGGGGSRHVSPPPQNIGRWAVYGRVPRPVRSRDGGRDVSPTEETRGGRPSSHVPIRAERPTLDSHTLPPSRNETIGDRVNLPLNRNKTIRPRDEAWSRTLRQRPLNRETLSDRPTPPAIPQRTTNHPEQTIERSKHDSQTNPKDGNARIDDEPLHHEAHRTSAAMTTTREPMLGAHTARVVERARKRDTVAETHFQSNLSRWTYWYVTGLCRTVSHNVNTVLLQHAPNLLSLLRVYASNTNATVHPADMVLNNFELKRDAVQPENDFPAQ